MTTKSNVELYTNYVRQYIAELSLKVSNSLIHEAIQQNKYFRTYYDKNSVLLTEGIDPSSGPKEFDVNNFDTENIGVNQYESSLIYNYLVQINNLIKKYNITTIQSEPSYYIDDITFEEPYLQLPFIEFLAYKNSIPVLKRIVGHPLVSSYLTITSHQVYHEKEMLRLIIFKPYVDQFGGQISSFDDSLFWNNIVNTLKDIHDENIVINEITVNDQDLDKTQPWFIRDDKNNIVEIVNKNQFNPYFPTLPLSTLDIRYNNSLQLFFLLN